RLRMFTWVLRSLGASISAPLKNVQNFNATRIVYANAKLFCVLQDRMTGSFKKEALKAASDEDLHGQLPAQQIAAADRQTATRFGSLSRLRLLRRLGSGVRLQEECVSCYGRVIRI